MGEIFEQVIPSIPLEWTGERFTTTAGRQVEIEHLHRYFFARELCRGLDVLDIAAGEGYGAAFLAQTARSVVGVELSTASVTHAATTYIAPNLRFINGDARSIPLTDASVDIIVSFETIEHFHEHGAFLREVRRVLRSGGRFVVSSPERDVYSPANSQPNPYHVHELTRTEFTRLLQRTFPYLVVQAQRPLLGSALVAEKPAPEIHEMLTFERRGQTRFESSEGLPRPLYLLAVASDKPITCLPDSLYVETSAIGEILVDVPAMRDQLQRSSDALAEAGAYAQHLEEDLRARDDARAESQAVRLERDAAVAAAEAAGAERDAAVAAAEAAGAERDAAVAAAEAAGAERDAAVAAVEAAGAERDAAVAAVEAATEALNHARLHARALDARLTAVLSSRSWRLSAPLRAVVNRWRSKGVQRRSTPLPACIQVQDRSLAQTPVPAALAAAQPSPNSPIEAEHKASLTLNATTDLKDFLASGDRINFCEARSRDISVLIVLWNQAHLSLRCLRALHRELQGPRRSSPEVVLVDNASSDETEKLISRLDGVQVIRNYANVGYLRAANQAAEAARGRILLFLNSDAFVRPGALRAAQAALESAPDIGAVGGRLILPSGRLQEAGSIVWSDASALGYGRGWPVDIGEVMFRREVDYCSGAFLMTPRGLWQKLGGYDEVYAPSYYEDTDYCERVWEAGFRVVYEPAAVVDHYEFGSEANPGEANAVFAVNRKRFRARHAKGLRVAHLPFAPTNVLAARERHTQGQRHLLVFDNEVPLRMLGSGYPRMLEILVEAAKAGWSVSLFPIHQLIVDWDAVRPEIPWEIEILSGRGVSGIAKFLEERRGHYDVALVSRPDNMALLRPVLRERPQLMDGTRLIYDAEALFSARKIAEAAFEGRPLSTCKADRMINDEVALAETADAIICVTEAEAREFRNRQVAPVHVLGHSTSPRFDAPGFDGRHGFLFVGRLIEQDAPNWRGLSWFIREVWPLVRAELPEATIVVAGHLHRNSSALEAPGVQLLGPISNLGPLYDAARVFVAPINFAAGLPHKITEATEAGLPTAATRLMARQLGWTAGTEIAAEDEPSSLAAAALALHNKETVWTAMREAAQQRLLREHGVEEFRKRLYAVLDGSLFG